MLRRATPEDADALATILRAAMQKAMPSLPELHTPEEDRSFLREMVLPNEEVWVIERDAQIVGFAALGSRQDVDYLQHIYVGPEHQGRGVGSELFTHAKNGDRRGSGSGSFSATRVRDASTRGTVAASSS